LQRRRNIQPKDQQETNLGLDKNGLNVVWAGLPGMKISVLVSLVQAMVNCVGLPHALMIYCGGNDIGIGYIREVLKHSIYATFIVSKMLPNSLLIYSHILPRKKWRCNSNLKAMERGRKRINRGIRTCYYKSNAKVITHADLQDGHKALYADDGIHLSFWEMTFSLMQFNVVLSNLLYLVNVFL
jgi:hypothetical protein